MPNESHAWIIGWNNHSLNIIVAWFLRNCSLLEARKQLRHIQSTLRSSHGYTSIMPYEHLQILGCLHATASFPSAINAAVDHDDEEHILRSRKGGYLWLELQEGPVLGELWCCGTRVQPCQLLIVRCKASRSMSIRPTIFSATALYGVGGVRKLRDGMMPVCAPGAQSNMEGVLLPPVMLKEAAPRRLHQRTTRDGSHPAGDGGGSGGDPSFFAANDPINFGQSDSFVSMEPDLETNATFTPSHGIHYQGSESFLRSTTASQDRYDHRSLSNRELAGVSMSESIVLSDVDGSPTPFQATVNAAGSDLGKGESDERGRGGSPTQQQARESKPLEEPKPGIPPRLDFHSLAAAEEMSVILATMRATRNVRRVIQQEQPHKYVEQDAVEPLRGVKKVMVNLITTYIMGILKLLRPMKTADLLLYRVAEFVHFISAISSASHSCGLHPILPHQVSTSPNHRYVCIFSYLSRCAIDLALGVLVYLCASAWGPSLYTSSQYITRHWLYEVHASYMDWFDGWPAGLKVNEDLNIALCFFAKSVLSFWDAVLSWSPFTIPSTSLARFATPSVNDTTLAAASSAPPSAVSFSVASSGDWEPLVVYDWIGIAFNLRVFCLLGCSTAAAFVSDLTSLVSLHLRFLYHAMALAYRFFKVLLQSLFQQFYGVRYNPLRNRSDIYHFHTDQMLAATFFFTITVFLFPTLAVYYLYFSFVLSTVWWMEVGLESLAYLVLHIPVYPILYWAVQRHRLSGGVALSNPIISGLRRFAGRAGPKQEGVASYTVEVTVQQLPHPLSLMLSDFAVVFDTVLRRPSPLKIVSFVLRGRMEPLPYMADVLGSHLLADCIDPPCTLCAPSSTSHLPSEKSKGSS